MNSLALQNESESKWKIDSSFKYDLLCFVNILTGNDFYAKRFPNEFTMFHEKLSDSELKALENIDREIRIENKGIISAMLCLYFSAVPDLTFDQIIERFENFNLMKTNLQIAGYYSEDSWNSFISIKDDLKVVIEFLRDNGFLEYWSSNCKPLIDQRIKEVSNITDNFDIFVEVERITKIKKEPIPIEIFFLKFAKPHGMRIVGSAFITDISWDNKITLRTAVHEMLHGNIDWESENMKQVIEILNEDDFVMDKVKNHNPAFGYNTLEGYLEE
ncbi:MAG: hypothetical protein JW870_10085, partial [Candidatus Delongbacteria bacterium]|nr:hypothetical protein [Candidatus Delongbacteria bacterium]